MIRPVVRALAALISLITAVFGAASTAAAFAAPTFGGPSYAFDISHHSAAVTETATERSPPTTCERHTAYDAVDHRSRGTAACSLRASVPTTYSYDDPAKFVQLVGTAVTTSEVEPGTQRTLAPSTRAGVAAKGVRVSAGEGLERAPGALVRNVGPHENMGALCDELCSLTYASGREHALVNTSSGFQIHAGGATGIDLSSDVTQVLAHTHPYHLPALGPSADDVAMLSQLGQSTSILLEHGQTILFGRGGTITWR